MAHQPEEDRSSRQEPCLKTSEAKSGGRNMSNYPNLLAITPKPYNRDPCNKERSTSTRERGNCLIPTACQRVSWRSTQPRSGGGRWEEWGRDARPWGVLDVTAVCYSCCVWNEPSAALCYQSSALWAAWGINKFTSRATGRQEDMSKMIASSRKKRAIPAKKNDS